MELNNKLLTKIKWNTAMTPSGTTHNKGVQRGRFRVIPPSEQTPQTPVQTPVRSPQSEQQAQPRQRSQPIITDKGVQYGRFTLIPPGIQRGRFLVTPTTPEQLEQIRQEQQTVQPQPTQPTQPTPPIITEEGVRHGRFLILPKK